MYAVEDTMSVIDEWNKRKLLLDELLNILSDGNTYTTGELLSRLFQVGVKASDYEVNSVLMSEGHQYVHHSYDRKNHFYSIPVDKVGFTESTGHRRLNDNVLRAEYIGANLQYICRLNTSTNPAFFDIEIQGSRIIVKLNKNHPLIQQLKPVLKSNPDELSVDELRDCLADAQAVIDAMLIAWGMYEQREPDGIRRIKAQEARMDWGRMLREFLLDEEDS